MTTSAMTLAERVGELVRIPSVNPLQAGPKSGTDGGSASGGFYQDPLTVLSYLVLPANLPQAWSAS